MGGRRRTGTREGVVRVLDLPPEVVLHVPRLILVGNMHLTVENHRGVLEFGPGRLVVGIGEGQVVVEGEDLHITHVGREELAVTGRIQALRFS